MASPARNILAASGLAMVPALLLAVPAIGGISSWKILLGAVGLILFIRSSRRAETK